MPFIDIVSSTGRVRFHYTISSPLCANAEVIEPGLPILLFFHALAYHTIFHSQFSDPILRRFNLVTFDLRWHGDTESDAVPTKYGQEEAAEDVIAFIVSVSVLYNFIFLYHSWQTALQLPLAILLPRFRKHHCTSNSCHDS
ncbi:hypothetical protein DFJ43DRAFT_1007041 [Lentinula guzmanii]|uniref:Uncharacterized protein n=1 Tax=Lentinula guzmanii TaxID=2804957 RepID=A0AA38MVY8_9AGAR|nr:hypothetical protein DFJ43DRAFT_1007041 [Lentinula guzmanii]